MCAARSRRFGAPIAESARGESMFRRVIILSAVLLAGVIPATAIAQTAGVVGGVVRDSSGGAIPGATIRVINEATGAAQDAVSDAEGN
jgi:hypothetical protein